MVAASQRLLILAAFAAASTAIAWVVFTRLSPMHVLVGTQRTDATVPLGYQLSVFPAFGAFVGGLALDVGRGEARRSWGPRALLVGSLGLLAVARLAGAVPLSGHGLFLCGATAYALGPPPDRDATTTLALVAPALMVVAWCKLVVWGDPLWLGASAVLGALVGAGLARAARA